MREAVAAGEGELTVDGALRVMTGPYTGRSPGRKFTVRREESAGDIDWSSRFNLPMEPEEAEAVARRFAARAARLPRLYGFRGFVGRGPHRLSVALITEFAWHALMGQHLYVRPTPQELARHRPGFTLLYLPSAVPDPGDEDGSAAVIVCDLECGLGLIGGTRYGGEEKKFFFYLLNYRLPLEGSFPMHCSANAGPRGDVSVLFGLSGTGKTTLSADPERRLIGDDEHGWDQDGVFNFEGGCYAKLFRLSPESEPLIWGAVNRPCSLLENVKLVDGRPDFDDPAVENTRGVYPLEALPNVEPSGTGGHPTTVVFLTFDASGTLPPISVLTLEQALYWFLAGYTARVAGTEVGLGTRPEPTFSACFGAPFLPWHPRVYVALLRDYLRRYEPLVVLINTGAIGGPYGDGGRRPPIEATRAMLRGAQSGALRTAELRPHPQFGILVPAACPGVPPELLDPRPGWCARSGGSYESAARELIGHFRETVDRVYRGAVDAEVLQGGPRI